MSSIDGYKILQDKSLTKSIKKNLPSHLKKVLDKKLKYLSQNPFHTSLNTKKYESSPRTCARIGVDEIWEFYINMSFRCVLYVIHEERLIVVAYVGNHDDVKRRFS